MHRSYGIMWKTVSEDCNLACDYCYYSRVLGKPAQVRRPTDVVLEKVLREYLATCGATASIAWQGGEPLLAGLPFFRRVVALEAEYAHPPMTISNAVQTNGVLINERWAQFFREYRFLVGVSLDGPEAIHDAHRVDGHGRGSYARVRRGIEFLQEAGVEFNILTVVGPHNVEHGAELLEFYRRAGFAWIQFIPQMGFHSQQPGDPGAYAISPDAYGQFLCDTFDAWYGDGQPTMSIRYFDNVLQTYVGVAPDICTMQAKCPPHLIVDSNGDLYPCDFFFDEEWRLGNIRDLALADAFETAPYARFAAMKPDLPEKCQTCPWLKHCRGGCPRNRMELDGTTDHPDYFCAAFEQFFAYADDRLKELAKPIRTERSRRALLRL